MATTTYYNDPASYFSQQASRKDEGIRSLLNMILMMNQQKQEGQLGWAKQNLDMTGLMQNMQQAKLDEMYRSGTLAPHQKALTGEALERTRISQLSPEELARTAGLTAEATEVPKRKSDLLAEIERRKTNLAVAGVGLEKTKTAQEEKNEAQFINTINQLDNDINTDIKYFREQKDPETKYKAEMTGTKLPEISDDILAFYAIKKSELNELASRMSSEGLSKEALTKLRAIQMDISKKERLDFRKAHSNNEFIKDAIKQYPNKPYVEILDLYDRFLAGEGIR